MRLEPVGVVCRLMKRNQIVKDYLTFSRKERIGLVTLVLLIIAIVLLPTLAGNHKSMPVQSDTSWMTAANKLLVPDSLTPNRSRGTREKDRNEYDYQYDRAPRYSTPHRELFPFDPNTLDEAG